ncbi:MAG: PAS domain S-box protein [Solirubrobacteraceae bacterium]
MGTDQHTDRDGTLFEIARDALVIIGGDGTVHRANAAALEQAGLEQADFVGRHFWELLHPGDRAAAAAQFADVVEAGSTERPVRYRIQRPDGVVRWVETHASVDQRSGLIYAVGRDVTGRENAELDRLSLAFADAPLGMALVGLTGGFLRVNAALARMLARSEDELLERTLADVVAPTAEQGWDAEALRAAGGSLQAEVELLRADERPAYALLTITPVHNAAGGPQQYVFQVLDMTERHEAQARLAANEAKLAEAQQIARLGSWEWTLATDRVSWSDELCRIHGVRIDQAPATWEQSIERLHPDDRARVARVVDAALAEHRSWSVDYRIARTDGEVRMVHARGEVVLDDDGAAVAVHGTCQDVTEGRRVEDALRAAEQLFRRAFDDAPIGMALIDLEGRWLRLNRAICRMLGRTEHDLRATRLNELSHPEDRDLDAPLVRELLTGRRRSFAVERRYLHADGRVIHALVHASLMHGDGERPLYFLCQLVDISERRRAEAERRAGEARLQAIIDNSPTLISVKDLQRRYLLVNRRWEETYGISADQALGRTGREVGAPDAGARTDSVDDDVAAAGAHFEEMTTVTTADGRELALLVVKFPLRDADGAIYAVGTVATDLTERRREADERIELEHRLAQAQRMESVGQLAGGVAHDFNNLLSVILTCVGFAKQHLHDDHAVRDDVEEIARAAERASALTRQLLMFSRREVVRPEIVDVGTLVRDLERLLDRTLSERISLRLTVGPGLVPVHVDPAQLEQVLVNLAVNARDAMPDGGTLAIAVSGLPPREGGVGSVRITVADSGAGMADEVRERAFEPFFTTKERGQGTGLGLATVHGIVTESGGTVDIDSAPGRGTLISIELPGTEQPVRPAEPPEEPEDRAAGGARVLVVEDQEPVRRQACRILEAHGYEVLGAGSGDEALETWRPVDVLVTDVVMPGMSGHELAEAARERAPGLRVVYMSGHTEDVLVREGARAGDIAFVQKPFTRASLLRAVDAALAAAEA